MTRADELRGRRGVAGLKAHPGRWGRAPFVAAAIVLSSVLTLACQSAASLPANGPVLAPAPDILGPQGLREGQSQLAPLEGEALIRAFSGRQFRGYETAPWPGWQSFHPDGRFVSHWRGPIEGVWRVDGERLCHRTPLQTEEECRYFAADPAGRIYLTGRERDSVRTDFENPYALVLAPLED